MKFKVQHEMDFEPTYVVRDDYEVPLVTLSERLDARLRIRIAKMIADELNKDNSDLVSDERLAALKND